jgi:pyruvate/2-oxoglutarate dehydrogenase complex dihydrolipoamide dehydrogenase (E3) component
MRVGFAKVICDSKGRILGAHIVGTNAGEIIHEYVLAKTAGIKINKLSSTIHVYPTLAQVVKRSADQYYLDILSSRWFRDLAKLFVGLMR